MAFTDPYGNTSSNATGSADDFGSSGIMTAPSTVSATSAAEESTNQLQAAAEPRHRSRWRRGWTRRRFLSIGGVAVLVGGAVAGTWAAAKGSAKAPAALSVTTQTVRVSSGTMKQTVATAGTIEPGSQGNLSFPVSGKVTAVEASVGQHVTSGQALATIDTTTFQYQVNAAQESLSAAQSRLSTDQADAASTSQIDSDEAAVTSAEAQLATSQTNLSDTTLTSPIGGTVASVNLAVGQEVSATGSSPSANTGSTSASAASGGGGGGTGAALGLALPSSSSSSSGSAQIVVESTSSYVVDATVDDTQVGQVQTGDQATIVPSGSTSTVYGTVSSVGLVAESSGSSGSSVASFPVVVSVTGSPAGLYSGSTATVSIVVRQLNDVVEVPTAAISYQNGSASVIKVVNGQNVIQAVGIGVNANGYTQITTGLSAGDTVLERVVKFNGTSGGANRSVLGGSGGSGGGFVPGGGFGGGGFGGRGAGGIGG